jgi:hypothetical protein
VGDLRFCYLNPGGLASFDELQIFFDNLAMDVICISETWLKKHHSEKKFRMNGFTPPWWWIRNLR